LFFFSSMGKNIFKILICGMEKRKEGLFFFFF